MRPWTADELAAIIAGIRWGEWLAFDGLLPLLAEVEGKSLDGRSIRTPAALKRAAERSAAARAKRTAAAKAKRDAATQTKKQGRVKTWHRRTERSRDALLGPVRLVMFRARMPLYRPGG